MKIKVIIPVILLVLAAVGGWYFFLRSEPFKPGLIVALGDDLTAGFGVGPDENYVAVLSKTLGLEVVNAGKNGDTTETALTRLDTDVRALNPRVVIVLLGGNDILRGFAPQEVEQRLASIVQKLQIGGARVLLLGVRGGAYKHDYDTVYNRVASTSQAAYLPNILEGIVDNAELMADPIHPNANGHKKIAERMEKRLRDMLKVIK